MAGKRYETKVITLQPAENQVRRVALEFSILTAVMALAMAVFLVSPACGASNPHGNFSSETDKCGSCHRMHTSVTSALTPVEQTGKEPTRALCKASILTRQILGYPEA
jgi:predicted CXXCH cytochrome family protein